MSYIENDMRTVLYGPPMKVHLAVFLSSISTLAFSTPTITSMTNLRGKLLAEILVEEKFRCAFELVPREANAEIPFKVVVGVSTLGKTGPNALRNRGAAIVRELAKFYENNYDYDHELEPVARITQPVLLPRYHRGESEFTGLLDAETEALRQDLILREIPVTVTDDFLTTEAGISIYVARHSGRYPVREHLLFVETFPHQGVSGALFYDLSRELKLNPRQDILVIHQDVDLKRSDSGILTDGFRDNGNWGTRSIARALGMPNPQLSSGDRRLHLTYPFSIVRQGTGRPPERGASALRDYLDQDWKSFPPDVVSVLCAMQRWLTEKYYGSGPLPPTIGRDNETDPRFHYSGQLGRSRKGER